MGKRRDPNRNPRGKSKKPGDSLFFKSKNPGSNHANKFSEEELQAIGLGYDRMVRFMDKDDPNLRHPHDWYKYGEYGPYSWRGVVVGDPVRGTFSDDRVTLIEEVKSQEEWEKIAQFEMATDFSKNLEKLDKGVGFRYFWVFVRHPKWRLSELPWEQWTLVSEVVVEAPKKERLDKWSLMGRLGNKTRSLITQCAAWLRPDIIYVKKPVYQCRFEPQDDFFSALVPYLDPKTEGDFLCEVENEDGSVQHCTYFAGLCKIVKVNPKAFVDDVVKGYEKLSEEGKSRCLKFVLGNHPVHLLHPYTKEWKAKLEEEEMGCDAPDDDEDERGRDSSDAPYTEWIEVDEDDEEREDEDSGEDDEEVEDEEDSADEKKWEEEFQKSLSSSEKMENLVKKSVEITSEFYERQFGTNNEEDGDETEMRGKRAKVSPKEWEQSGIGRWGRRVKKSEVPPEMFLRAAVRPFTYRNLVKEIVLTRHALLEGGIGKKK